MPAVRAWFNVRKAAQVVVFFAMESGGSINVLKLIKLVYLANRKALEKFEFPIINDNFVSMDHGPVNSLTYDFINGTLESDDWEQFVSARAAHMVGLADPKLSLDDLDEFSTAELKVLAETWREFGAYDKWLLVRHVHEECPEWHDPQGSSLPITYEEVFRALKKPDSKVLQDNVLKQRQVDVLFSRS